MSDSDFLTPSHLLHFGLGRLNVCTFLKVDGSLTSQLKRPLSVFLRLQHALPCPVEVAFRAFYVPDTAGPRGCRDDTPSYMEAHCLKGVTDT